MIIDSHIHFMESYGILEGSSPSSLKEELNKRGIQKAWAFTMSGFYGNCAAANDALKEACDICPETFVPFMTVNPRDGKVAIEEMERAYFQLGMKGLKIHPWCQSFSLTEKWFHAMCEKCIDLSIPLVTHDGTPPFGESLQACYIAEKYPKLKVILGHSGLNDLWKEALYGAMRLSNVYLGTCTSQYYGLKQMIKQVGSERVLFGSDGGFGHSGVIDSNLEKIYQMELSASDLDNVLYKTAQSLIES